MDGGESIGMMAGAYFVGRVELLRWINQLTGLNYSKIEQTASGVFACHVFDALFPGSIRLEKVKFNAKQQYEFVHNYKVLQAAFNRNNMKKQIDVEKLIKGKYQDNLEFMQWIKAFYDSHASEEALNYDGRARREELMSKTPGARRPALATNRQRVNETAAPAPARKAVRSRPSPVPRTKPGVPMVKKSELDDLKAEFEKLETSLADAEAERSFYFNKLRAVEVIIQAVQEDMKEGEVSVDSLMDVFDEIKNTLYSEDDTAAPLEDEEGYEGGEELPAEEYNEDLPAEAE